MKNFKIGDYLKTKGEIYWIYAGNDIWLSEEIFCKLPFDDNDSNNWKESSLKTFLNDTFKEKFQLKKYTDEVFLLSEEEFDNIDEKFKAAHYCEYQCNYWFHPFDVYYHGGSIVRYAFSDGEVYYGCVCDGRVCNSYCGIRPAFKLNPTSRHNIIGDGTKENPYEKKESLI